MCPPEQRLAVSEAAGSGASGRAPHSLLPPGDTQNDHGPAHRVAAKALAAGLDAIDAVRFERDPVPDHVDVRPEDLPYRVFGQCPYRDGRV